MAKLLYKLGRWSYLNKWKVIIAWLLILAASAGAAFTLSKPFTSNFAIDGTPAIEALGTMERNFPGGGNVATAPGVNLVFAAPEGEQLTEPAYMAAMDEVITHIDEHLVVRGTERFGNPVLVNQKLQETIVGQMTQMGLPEEAAQQDAYNLRLVSDDGRIGYTTFEFDAESNFEVTEEDRQIVADAMDIGRAAGLQVEAGGAGYGDPIEVNTTSELIGIGVAFLVLLVTFGSFAASTMPIVSAIVGVGIGALAILTTTYWVELNDVTPVLAVMIGLAVGIDYSLFILSRYRQERKTRSGPDAAGMAVGTAGSSVVFAGATVFVALVALVLAGIEFLSWMGVAAAFTVFVSVLVALTMLPALLGAWGNKAFAGRIPKIAGEHLHERSMGRNWVNFVRRFPALVMAVVVLTLGAMSAPVLGLQMALPSDSTSNLDTTQRKSADLMAEGFGPGVNAPLLLVVDAHGVSPDAEILQPYMAAMPDEAGGRAQKAALASFLYAAQEANSVSGVVHAQLVNVNEDFTAAQIMATPDGGPEEEYTLKVAHGLRENNQQVEDATGVDIGLTGLTAVQMDITEELAKAMPLYLAIVVGLAIVLLMVVFRSILVPLVAGLGFLLSVGAAFGLTVLVWQDGLWGLVNTPTPILSFLPIFMIGVTFGLAMDYQVFLVTRMREHYLHLVRNKEPHAYRRAVVHSTVEGFAQGARVVTAAAIIMIAVFVAFINQPLPFIQIFGFALGVAVLFDAFFVRMALVPATMFLMGPSTWWMPKWLDKVLPEVDVEGTELEELEPELEGAAR